jgi:CMP-N-acetylneuraminic acid synthetase
VRAIADGLAARLVDRVVLTSDYGDVTCRSLATQHGLADADWDYVERPRHLARDKSPIEDAMLHALLETEGRGLPKATHVVLLNPTSPLRQPATIDKAVELALADDLATVVTVCATVIPHRLWHPCQTGRWQPSRSLYGSARHPMRQDWDAHYFEHGAAYVVRRDVLDRGTLYGEPASVVETTEVEACDIDTEADLVVARALWHEYRKCDYTIGRKEQG